MDLKLKGKRALVTGGSKGIGWASACALADEGCDVLIAARNAPAGDRFRFRATDLSQRGGAEALAERAGDLDIKRKKIHKAKIRGYNKVTVRHR